MAVLQTLDKLQPPHGTTERVVMGVFFCVFFFFVFFFCVFFLCFFFVFFCLRKHTLEGGGHAKKNFF